MSGTTDHYDVIVIGSGAGGGTLTHALAPTGKRILLLERGGWMPRERENWDSRSVWLDHRYTNAGQWTDAATGKRFTPKQHYYVGGNTKVYGAILFRFRERDFGAITHVDGVSPAWPIDYADLRAAGLNPFPLPNGILLNEAAPEVSACVRCATCDGYPCLVNGKADAQVIAVVPALRHPNVTLRTNALVTRLETDPSGRTVSRVVVERNG